MKGPAVQEELNGSSYAIELWEAKRQCFPSCSPDGEERTLIKNTKKRFTPKRVSSSWRNNREASFEQR